MASPSSRDSSPADDLMAEFGEEVPSTETVLPFPLEEVKFLSDDEWFRKMLDFGNHQDAISVSAFLEHVLFSGSEGDALSSDGEFFPGNEDGDEQKIPGTKQKQGENKTPGAHKTQGKKKIAMKKTRAENKKKKARSPTGSNITQGQAIDKPVRDKDVACLRGQDAWRFNEHYRGLVRDFHKPYFFSTTQTKRLMVKEILKIIKSKGGRFLDISKVQGEWVVSRVLSDKQALQKIRAALKDLNLAEKKRACKKTKAAAAEGAVVIELSSSDSSDDESQGFAVGAVLSSPKKPVFRAAEAVPSRQEVPMLCTAATWPQTTSQGSAFQPVQSCATKAASEDIGMPGFHFKMV